MPVLLLSTQTRAIQHGAMAVTVVLMQCALSVVPFVAFQLYAYVTLCAPPSHASGLCMQTVPVVYAYVQEHYWSNGFLRYWTVKQVRLFVFHFCVLRGEGGRKER